MVDETLLDILICPLTGDKLTLQADSLVGVNWGVQYPIRNGIPIMLITEAELPQGIDSIEQLREKMAT